MTQITRTINQTALVIALWIKSELIGLSRQTSAQNLRAVDTV